MPKPLVSIVIPSYNRSKYLSATLNSILKQSFMDFEVIFVDDGSTDNTQEILNYYCQKDYRIKYFYQPNSERAVARSYGMGLALGEYVALVDSDDIWYPHKLEKQVAVLENNPDVILSYASVNRIDLDGRRVRSATRQKQGCSGYVFFDLLMRNFVPSVTPLFRKEIIKKAGDQVSEYIPYEDWDYWLRLSRLGKFHHIQEPLGAYRLHPGQSVQNVKPEKIEDVTLKVLKHHTNLANFDLQTYLNLIGETKSLALFIRDEFQAINNEAYSLANLRFAYWYILAGDLDTGRRKLKKSLELSSARKKDLRWWGLKSACYLEKTVMGDSVKSFLGALH